MNIIDGHNGLASVVVAISLLSLAYVGWQVGDSLVVSAALAGVGALLGFLLWNWPRGLIFLGDSGAYHPRRSAFAGRRLGVVQSSAGQVDR